jgi:hypothetical protein
MMFFDEAPAAYESRLQQVAPLAYQQIVIYTTRRSWDDARIRDTTASGESPRWRVSFRIRAGSMTGIAGKLRKRLFGIDAAEVTFGRRGFERRDAGAVVRLEEVGGCFVRGYLAALEDPDPTALEGALRQIESENQGFAFEGAGMALALLDLLTPWPSSRLETFLRGPGEPHVYMVTIGAGWAAARVGFGMKQLVAQLDPVLGWLAYDGYGFHEGYFHPRRTIEAKRRPRRIRGHGARIFDTGLGRSLWFVGCATPDGVARRIASFEPDRQADLWAGAGLACAYAGGVTDAEIDRLWKRAGPHRGALAQGAAFAAKARQRAGIPAEHTRRAVERICDTGVDVAAKLCDTELARAASDAGAGAAQPVYEVWRTRIRETFEGSFEGREPRADRDA